MKPSWILRNSYNLATPLSSCVATLNQWNIRISYIFYFKNHRISLCIYTKLSNFTKITIFLSYSFKKGYRIVTIFLQIIYFMKRRAKLADSNMEFHGFFHLRRDTTGAWSVFHFLNSLWLPWTAAAKINLKHKKSIFSCFLFFLSFWEFHRGWQTF